MLLSAWREWVYNFYISPDKPGKHLGCVDIIIKKQRIEILYFLRVNNFFNYELASWKRI